jgi:hypothetical protein
MWRVDQERAPDMGGGGGGGSGFGDGAGWNEGAVVAVLDGAERDGGFDAPWPVPLCAGARRGAGSLVG